MADARSSSPFSHSARRTATMLPFVSAATTGATATKTAAMNLRCSAFLNQLELINLIARKKTTYISNNSTTPVRLSSLPSHPRYTLTVHSRKSHWNLEAIHARDPPHAEPHHRHHHARPEFLLEPNEPTISGGSRRGWASSIQMTTHTQFAGGGIFGVLKRGRRRIDFHDRMFRRRCR